MSKAKRLYVDVHVLQTVPPSCVNRDDTGSPKTAMYGGVTRARVSSQAWKHAMRQEFTELFAEQDVGYRTKKFQSLIVQELCKLSPALAEEDADKIAEKGLNALGLKSDKKDKKLDALIFVSEAQAKAVAALALAGETDKKKYQEAMKTAPSADIALFGRMVASDPSLDYDAAAQVAHSLSTHAVHNEYDYFTAVDDCQDEGSNGAAHVDTSEFNSSTLYRYANVNVQELAHNVGANTAQTVCNFLKAFIHSMPTGKQNSYANRTWPDMVYVAVRYDQPMNLVGAFEKPVAAEGGYMKASVSRLAEYADMMYGRYDAAPEKAWVLGDMDIPDAENVNIKELLKQVEEYISKEVG